MVTLTTGGANRRSFLRRGAAAGGRFAVGAMEGLSARAVRARDGERDRVSPGNGGYGDLRALTRTDPDSGASRTLLLPEGFDFAVCSAAGSPMRDKVPTPPAHGGMACFATGRAGEWRLVRGHGARTAAAEEGRGYDALGAGATTTLKVRWEDGAPRFEEVWRSLSGTVAARAGGPTPWGSWLSCEATTAGTGAGWARDHGYAFEVPSAEEGEVEPLPLKAMGRFVHEAVAVDPRSGAVYQTEDQRTAGFYRYVPDAPGDLAGGGRLEMLKVGGAWNFDTRTGQRSGRSLAAEWVAVDDPDPAGAEADELAVFNQGWARGAAVFGRLEGCFYADGAVYFASASGGDEGEGQLWEYRPLGRGGGTLTLVFESPDAALLSYPDAVAVSPGGNLILCENAGAAPALRGATREGEVFPLARGEDGAAWRGACFSPDGRVLFANLQDRGDGAQESAVTVAVWGPWSKGVL